MKTSVPSQPARIVKRAEVDAGPARPAASDDAVQSHAPVQSETPPAKRLAKQARLLPGTAGTSAVEVRCSCGEWTRIELQTLARDPEDRR